MSSRELATRLTLKSGDRVIHTEDFSSLEKADEFSERARRQWRGLTQICCDVIDGAGEIDFSLGTWHKGRTNWYYRAHTMVVEDNNA